MLKEEEVVLLYDQSQPNQLASRPRGNPTDLPVMNGLKDPVLKEKPATIGIHLHAVSIKMEAATKVQNALLDTQAMLRQPHHPGGLPNPHRGINKEAQGQVRRV